MTIPPRHTDPVPARRVRVRGVVALAALLLFYLVAGLWQALPLLAG